MTTTQTRIEAAAINAAISIARLAPREHVDIDLGNRLSHARAALVEANRRNDLFAAACAVEQMERAVMERPAAEIAVSAN